ncbi:MAG: sensor histidine kinase [Solirubrobacteraceae bacterium]
MTGGRVGEPAQPPGFVHQALIYDSDEEFVAFAVPFLSEGAAAGQPTVLSVEGRLRRRVRDELGPLSGVTFVDDDDRRWLEALRGSYAEYARRVDAGASQIRVLGGSSRDPWHDWVRFEASINRLFSAFPLWGVCPYDTRVSADDVLQDVVRTHPYVTVDGGRMSPNACFEDPVAFLNQRAQAAADPLERCQPDVELFDPVPAAARTAVTEVARQTRLERDEAEAVRLSVGEVVTNAVRHGRPPVHVSIWAAPDRVVVIVRDNGPGPGDPFVGLLPLDPLAGQDDANPLHVIRHAVSDVSLFTDVWGFFTTRLVQRISTG